ncbi:MAG: magnesium chelatase domain-containing protein, partial [Planctomycetota bacterium]
MLNRQFTQLELQDLLRRDHTLHGGVLFGIDGHVIELQARAVSELSKPLPFYEAVSITGMARGVVYESLDRIRGAFMKLGIASTQVEILINLAPPDLPKEGTWLDLPLAIIMLQAAGLLPDLYGDREQQLLLMGEIGLHGEIRRVPGALSLAYLSKPGQQLIVPAGNEKECALIMAKPGHDGCGVFCVSELAQVIDFFQGRRKLDNVLRNEIKFEDVIPRAVDFSRIKGQERAK